jgi:uncharacterized protein
VTARAYSTDGRTFAFAAALTDAIPVGSYVTIHTEEGDEYLGRVLSASADSANGTQDGGRSLGGTGRLLCRVADGTVLQLDNSASFGESSMIAADRALVAEHMRWERGSTAAIALGQLQQPVGVTALLHAKGFGRHTFLCGQSGSGKTYTLGVVLEQLLLGTDIRIVVIDPNSDFVNMDKVSPREATGLSDEEYRSLEKRYSEVAGKINVFGGEGAEKRLQAVFGRLSLRQQTMVLGLDPLVDADEYNEFVRIIARFEGADYSLDDIVTSIRSTFDDGARRLGLRIENLGLQNQSIWAGDETPMIDLLPEDWRMLVADIGSLQSAVEGSIAAAALLGFLWDHRRARQPVIIVIDEAHNVCPQEPIDVNQALATEHVVKIAAEGRKFGKYLLLATQQPAKVHRNVISQCDNLLLMKMNSASDIRSLSETFSYAPEALVELAAGFQLGEGLAAGKIAPDPLLFRSGQRLTVEGGSDVPSTWARAR